tara:strand:- start:30131 stop:31345 length:1215 start_codon:yes stop_codon:yes gene_type:complete
MKRYFGIILIVIFSGVSALLAQYETFIDAGELTFHAKEQAKPITITSRNPEIEALAKKAFALHGGYQLSPQEDSIFVFRLTEVKQNTLQLIIESGWPRQIIYQTKVTGKDFRETVLKTCDLIVLKTLGIPGFFQGKLAFVGERPPAGPKEVFTSDLFFTHVQQITSDNSDSVTPRWSPDGKKILYTGYYRTGFPDIFQIDLQTGNRHPFATYQGTNTGGVYDPTGKRVAMVLSSTGTPELYVSDARGKAMHRLTRNNSLKASPSWSPHGDRLLLTSDEMGAPQIYQISSQGGMLRRVPTNISKYCAEPAWNPRNANLFVFTVAVAGSFQLALFDFEKGTSRFITQGKADNLEASWANDGRHIIFTRRTPNARHLYIMDTETGKEALLSSGSFGNASEAHFVYAP